MDSVCYRWTPLAFSGWLTLMKSFVPYFDQLEIKLTLSTTIPDLNRQQFLQLSSPMSCPLETTAHQGFPDLPDDVFASNPDDPLSGDYVAPRIPDAELFQLDPIFLPPPLGPTLPNDTP